MITVTLQFPDFESLVRFKQKLDSATWEINFTLLTITCRCAEQILTEAMVRYGANRLEAQEQ